MTGVNDANITFTTADPQPLINLAAILDGFGPNTGEQDRHRRRRGAGRTCRLLVAGAPTTTNADPEVGRSVRVAPAYASRLHLHAPQRGQLLRDAASRLRALRRRHGRLARERMDVRHDGNGRALAFSPRSERRDEPRQLHDADRRRAARDRDMHAGARAVFGFIRPASTPSTRPTTARTSPSSIRGRICPARLGRVFGDEDSRLAQQLVMRHRSSRRRATPATARSIRSPARNAIGRGSMSRPTWGARSDTTVARQLRLGSAFRYTWPYTKYDGLHENPWGGVAGRQRHAANGEIARGRRARLRRFRCRQRTTSSSPRPLRSRRARRPRLATGRPARRVSPSPARPTRTSSI